MSSLMGLSIRGHTCHGHGENRYGLSADKWIQTWFWLDCPLKSVFRISAKASHTSWMRAHIVRMQRWVCADCSYACALTMHVKLCVRTFIYKYTCMIAYANIYTHGCMHAHVHVLMHACLNPCMQVHIFIYACKHKHMCDHIYTLMYILVCMFFMYVCICPYVYTYACEHVRAHVCICMHVLVCVCIYVCTGLHARACMCECMRACIYVCIYACMYVCMCVCEHTRLLA